ncbi:hypothetical protein ACLHDG_09075 [Sulfurovum sp. CS9]|uniref:hypothetical protein n=1 Tax=Sulfurovum sp. CS9 TaxID=3391146 RepID=UPI0039E8DB8C
MSNKLTRVKKLEQIRNPEGQSTFIFIDGEDIVVDGVKYDAVKDIPEMPGTTFIMIVEDTSGGRK